MIQYLKIKIVVGCVILGILVLCYIFLPHMGASPYRHTKTIGSMMHDNALLPANNQVEEFLWLGYSPNHFSFFEKKVSQIPKISASSLYSDAVIMSFFAEREAFNGHFDEIPQVLTDIKKILLEIKIDENPSIFLQAILPVLSSLTRIYATGIDRIPENVLRQNIEHLIMLDEIISKMPEEKSNHCQAATLFYIRASRILSDKKLLLTNDFHPKLKDPFSPEELLGASFPDGGKWYIRSVGSNKKNDHYTAEYFLPLPIDKQIGLSKDILLTPDLYPQINELWKYGKISVPAGTVKKIKKNSIEVTLNKIGA